MTQFFEWFKKLFTDFNGWMASVFKFDQHLLNFYNNIIAPLPEWVKMVGLVITLIALVLGTFQLIKKFAKLAIILLIVFALIVLITWL